MFDLLLSVFITVWGIIVSAFTVPYDYVPSADDYVSDKTWEEQAQYMKITCYTSSPNAHTYSGKKVFIGGCASNKENLGKIAYLYNDNHELIGTWECTDIGGHPMLRNGTALDLWQPSLDECWNYIRENSDHAWVVWVNADG